VTAPTPAALDAALAALETGGEPLGLRSARALAQLDAPAAGLRVVLVARDLAGLAEEARLARRGVPQAVTAGGAWATPAGSRFTAAPTGGEVCFVYPGLQALYPGAGRDLLQLHPAAHAALAAALRDPGAALRLPDLYPRLATPEDREEAEDALLADPHALIQAGVGVSVLQTRLLREALGLRPTSALGYSLGELTMLVALDMWPLSDTLHESLRGSEVLREELAGPRRAVARAWGEDAPAWEVWTLLTSRSRVEALQVPRVSWSLTPCDGEVVIAGHPEGCRAVIDALGCPAIAMPQGLAVHSPFVASAAAALARDLERPVQDPGLVLRTNGSDDGRMPLDAAGCAQALARSVCAPFDLPRLVEQAWADGARVFIEVGPGATCSRWIGATLAGRPHLAVSVDQRGVDDHSGLARLLAALLAHGVPVDLRGWIAGLDRGHAGTVPREVSLGGPSIPQALRAALARPAVVSADITPAVAPSAPPISNGVASPIAAHPTLTRAIHAAGRRAADAHLALLDARLRTLAGLRLAPFPDQPDARSRSAIHRERGPAAPQIPPSQRSVSKEGPVQGERWGSARPALDEAQVQAFANGRVQDALGPAWADVDALPRRLRTPSPPFLAISRVLRLEGEPRSLGTGRVSTELDLPRPSWYGVEGQVPWFALDAQGVLILASWLGVDTVNRGLRVFRWRGDHWYLRSHCIGDNVFTDPCMIEGSLQFLQIFLLLAQAGHGGRFLPIRSPRARVLSQADPGRSPALHLRAARGGLGAASRALRDRGRRPHL
jgi:PfaB family protein